MSHEFSGHIYIFQSFDVGDMIDLEAVKKQGAVTLLPLHLSKYFKNYHIPLEIEMPRIEVSQGEQATQHIDSVKLHNFGVITIRYKVPFTSSLDTLRTKIEELDNHFVEIIFYFADESSE